MNTVHTYKYKVIITGMASTNRICCLVLAAYAILLLAGTAAYAMNPKQLQHTEALRKDAELLLKDGRFKDAIPKLERIIEIDPNDNVYLYYLKVARRQTVENYCKQADDAYMKGNYLLAINEWSRITDLYPEDARVEKMIVFSSAMLEDNMVENLYSLVIKFIGEKDYSSAINELEKIIQMEPDEKRAKDLLITIIQLHNNARINELYKRAENHLDNKNFKLAIVTWREILKIDENQQEANRRIAEINKTKIDKTYDEARKLYESGQYLSSRELYNMILAENPEDLDTEKIISSLNQTIKIVKKITGDDKVSALQKQALANYISLTGNLKAAIAASWYAVQLDPDNRLSHAIKRFLEKSFPTMVLALEPPVGDMNLIDQYLFAALNHIYEGRYDLAIQGTSIVLVLDPQNFLAYKRLGSSYYAIGKKDKARATWENALRIRPDDHELKLFLKRLY
jgi:tetratricopeptide (TPR) repeat protein